MTGRRWLGLAIAAAAFGGLGARFFAAAHDSIGRTRANACRAMDPDPVPPSLVGRDAPDFELPDAGGRKWSLRALRGRPVLVNFWATWCPPCVDEMPSMEELTRKLGDRGPVVLSVSVDESWDVVKKFFAKGTRMSVLLDPSKDVAKSYGSEKFPESFLIDAQGRVRHYFINKRDWSRPEAIICMDAMR